MSSNLLPLAVLLSIIVLCTSQQLELPENPCPQYFEYVQSGNGYGGKLTVPNVPIGHVTVRATFSQRESTPEYNGRLSLWDEQESIATKIKNGLPIAYRVDFADPFKPLKLKSISVNGLELCSGKGYPGPHMLIDLDHKLTFAEQSHVSLTYTKKVTTNHTSTYIH